MEIGRFNQRITIQKMAEISDKIGNKSEKWENFYTCWAEVKILYGHEYNSARQENEQRTVNFKIRKCGKISGINSTDYRIFFRNNFYDIQFTDSIKPDFVEIRAINQYDRK